MAFDEAKFRAAAKADNYPDDEIEAYIASRKTAEPAAPKPFGAATEEFIAKGKAEQAAAKQATDVQAGPFTIPDWMTPALGTAAAGALGYGAKALVDKIRTPAPAPFTPIEPSFDIAPEPAAAPAPDPLKEAKLRQEQAKAALQELADATIKKDRDAIVDGVGDVMVCLVNYCALQDMNLVDCMKAAYEQIKDRKGTLMPNGVFVKA